jgi:hypothetical protein
VVYVKSVFSVNSVNSRDQSSGSLGEVDSLEFELAFVDL